MFRFASLKISKKATNTTCARLEHSAKKFHFFISKTFFYVDIRYLVYDVKIIEEYVRALQNIV